MSDHWPTHRNASPQAWRRLRVTMTDSELEDIAKDIAAFIGLPAVVVPDLAFALTAVNWEALKQGKRS